jgi:hypothetical protein
LVPQKVRGLHLILFFVNAPPAKQGRKCLNPGELRRGNKAE